VKSYTQYTKELEEKLSSGLKKQINLRNPEHPFIKAFKNDKDLEEIKELWDNGEEDEAARLFRSKLVKMSNSKLGISLLLMLSGSALASAGYSALTDVGSDSPIPQPPTAEEEGKEYIIKKGDSIWKIAKAHLPDGSNNADILAYTKQISMENGMNVDLIDGVLTKVPGDPDLIYPGGKLILNPFSK